MTTPHYSPLPTRLTQIKALTSVGLLALVVRLIHHSTLLDLPIYSFPVGIVRRFYMEGLQILDGHLLGDGSLPTENSPLFPYVLALYGYLFGEENVVIAARLSNIVFDSSSAILVSYATMPWGMRPALLAGIIYATSAPLIFFSSSLVSISLALFFISLSLSLLLRFRANCRAGVCLGIAATLLPTFLITAPFVALAAISWRQREWKTTLLRGALPTVAGIIIGISPISMMNYLRSGSFVLLTRGFGHNFYLAHNPSSEAGYTGVIDALELPQRGSTFEHMRDYGSQLNGEPLPADQVSSFFTRRAFNYIYHHPARELKLLATRALVALGSNEYTTYENYTFYQERSAILSYGAPFALLLVLGLVGFWALPLHEKQYLLAGSFGTYISLLIFFVISRIRMSTFPFLAIAAGVGADRLLKRQVPLRLLPLLLFIAIISLYPRPKLNPANEYNKVGWGYERLARYEEAKAYYEGALSRDPLNTDARKNLERITTMMSAKQASH